MKKLFSMSMYVDKEDLFMAKAEHLECELQRAAGMLSDLLTFVDDCEKRGVIDGACDPDLAAQHAKLFIRDYSKPDSNEDNYAISV